MSGKWLECGGGRNEDLAQGVLRNENSLRKNLMRNIRLAFLEFLGVFREWKGGWHQGSGTWGMEIGVWKLAGTVPGAALHSIIRTFDCSPFDYSTIRTFDYSIIRKLAGTVPGAAR